MDGGKVGRGATDKTTALDHAEQSQPIETYVICDVPRKYPPAPSPVIPLPECSDLDADIGPAPHLRTGSSPRPDPGPQGRRPPSPAAPVLPPRRPWLCGASARRMKFMRPQMLSTEPANTDSTSATSPKPARSCRSCGGRQRQTLRGPQGNTSNGSSGWNIPHLWPPVVHVLPCALSCGNAAFSHVALQGR